MRFDFGPVLQYCRFCFDPAFFNHAFCAGNTCSSQSIFDKMIKGCGADSNYNRSVIWTACGCCIIIKMIICSALYVLIEVITMRIIGDGGPRPLPGNNSFFFSGEDDALRYTDVYL